MYCSNCGAGNPNGAKFCEMCGAPLADASGPRMSGGGQRGASALTGLRERIGSVLRMILRPATAIIAAVVVFAVIAAVFAVRHIGRGGYTLREDTLVMGYDDDMDAELLAFASNGTVMRLNDTPGYTAPSLDGTRYVALTYNDDLYFLSSDADAPRKIAANADWCRIASDGSAVIYYDELTGMLCLYTTADGRRTEISDGVTAAQYAAVSAGGAVAYYVQSEDRTYLRNGGEITNIGKGLRPLAISDNNKIVYLIETDNRSVYTYTAKNGITKIASDYSGGFWFNRDATEMLFVNGRDRAVLVSDGTKQTDLISTEYGLDILQPTGAAILYDETGAKRYDINTFVGQFILAGASGGADLYRIERSGDCERLASGIEEAMVSANGESVYYIRNDDLYAADTDGKGGEFLLSDVRSAVPADGGGLVYAIDEDHELWELTDRGGKTRIADDVNAVAVSEKNVVYYLADDYRSSENTLYAYRKGKSSFLAEDAVSLADNGGCIVARTDWRDGRCSFCACVGNGRLTVLLEDVVW